MEQIWMNQYHNSSQTSGGVTSLSSAAFPKLSAKSNSAPRVSKSQKNIRAGVDQQQTSSSQIFDPVKWPSLAELECNQHNDSKNRSTDSEGSENTSTNAATTSLTNLKSAKQNAKNKNNKVISSDASFEEKNHRGKNSSIFNNLETALNLTSASDRDDFGLRGLATSIRRMCIDDKERNSVSGSLGSTAASSVASSISAENLGLGEALAFTSGLSNNDRSPHHSNSINQISSSRRPLLGRIYNSALDEQQASLWSSVHTEADYPEEYARVFKLQQKLPGPYCHPNWKTDLLFFFFYTAPGDGLQLAGASLLYERGWRYNMSNGMWIARIPNVPPEYRTNTLEKGDFQVFDPVSWSRKQVNLVLRYDDLATQTKVDPQHSRIYSILQQSASATRSNNNPAQSGSSRHGHGGNGGASQQAANCNSTNSNQQQHGSQQQHRHQQQQAVATAAAAQAAQQQQQQEQQRARQQQLYMNQQLQQFTRGAGGSGAGNGNGNAALNGNGNNSINATSATQTIENYLRLMHANNSNTNGGNYLI